MDIAFEGAHLTSTVVISAISSNSVLCKYKTLHISYGYL